MEKIQCTIIKSGRCDEYGRPLTVAQKYTGTLDYVRQLYTSGYATVNDVAVFDDDSTPQDSRVATVSKGRIPVEAELDAVTGGISLLIGGQSLGVGGTYTWATKPLPSALTGQIYISDIGVGGSYWYSDGSKWRPVGGRVTLKNTLVDVTNNGAAKVVMDYATIPAGLVADGDLLTVSCIKERTGGVTDTDTTDLCIGTTATAPGTTVGLGTGVLATTQIQFAANWSVRKESPTAVRPTAMTGSTGVGGATSANATATVPNMDTQPTYLQITSDLTNAAGEVVHLRGFTVTLVCGS